jgi:hypothetical protein
MYIGVVKIIDKNNNNILRITNLKHKGKPLEYAVKMRLSSSYEIGFIYMIELSLMIP